ncbi:hypothetical protein HPB50_023505 [Hyalomma asiaticum]|uniref:Uncharacterized protein n=1 Tax=Hyalomma asiaticum TaxID=266040 RepID=A0ACB7S8M2_HYAAI|nr:hypothetical protein HPB50_023505 [Hyalomma asiaticum]
MAERNCANESDEPVVASKDEHVDEELDHLLDSKSPSRFETDCFFSVGEGEAFKRDSLKEPFVDTSCLHRRFSCYSEVKIHKCHGAALSTHHWISFPRNSRKLLVKPARRKLCA